MTEKARGTWRQSFYEKTDPVLPEAERQRQATAAYRLHMMRLSRIAAAKRKLALQVRQAEAELAVLRSDLAV